MTNVGMEISPEKPTTGGKMERLIGKGREEEEGMQQEQLKEEEEEVDPFQLVGKIGQSVGEEPKLQFLKTDPHELIIEALEGTGMVNYIYRVASQDGRHSVVIKHGKRTMRMDRHGTLRMDRQVLEYNTMVLIHDVLPGYVPEPYAFYTHLHTMVMEDLSDMELLGSALRHGNSCRERAGDVGQMLGMLHFTTHRKNVTPERWSYITEKLHNTHIGGWLREARVCFVTTDSEYHFLPAGAIPCNEASVKQMREEKTLDKLGEMFDREDCVTHRDAHTNFCFFKRGRVAMLDFEFTQPGNPAFDMGLLLASYTLTMMEAREKKKLTQQEVNHQLTHHLTHLVESYLGVFGDRVELLGGEEHFVSECAAFYGQTLITLSTFIHKDIIVSLSDEMVEECVKKGYKMLIGYQLLRSMPAVMAVITEDISTDNSH